MRSIGKILLVVGGLMAAYALLIFDPSVSSGSGRVLNIGLLQDRQNLLLAGGMACIVGVLLVLFAPSATSKAVIDSGPMHAPEPRPMATDAELEFKHALEFDDVATMERLLQRQFSPHGRLATGRGFLQYAVLRRSKKAISLLLSKGASAEQVDDINSNAVGLAALSEDDEIKALIAAAVPTKEVKPENVDSPLNAKSRPESSRMPLYAQLERLAALRDSGALTADEFIAAKARVLAAKS
ncbi:SHOCT domain-containing protein [Rhizobacter fulvus]